MLWELLAVRVDPFVIQSFSNDELLGTKAWSVVLVSNIHQMHPRIKHTRTRLLRHTATHPLTHSCL